VAYVSAGFGTLVVCAVFGTELAVVEFPAWGGVMGRNWGRLASLIALGS
jgi:hypothetical protein